jgi:hypothetical protein
MQLHEQTPASGFPALPSDTTGANRPIAIRRLYNTLDGYADRMSLRFAGPAALIDTFCQRYGRFRRADLFLLHRHCVWRRCGRLRGWGPLS